MARYYHRWLALLSKNIYLIVCAPQVICLDSLWFSCIKYANWSWLVTSTQKSVINPRTNCELEILPTECIQSWSWWRSFLKITLNRRCSFPQSNEIRWWSRKKEVFIGMITQRPDRFFRRCVPSSNTVRMIIKLVEIINFGEVRDIPDFDVAFWPCSKNELIVRSLCTSNC